jgi:hypothetical protein
MRNVAIAALATVLAMQAPVQAQSPQQKGWGQGADSSRIDLKDFPITVAPPGVVPNVRGIPGAGTGAGGPAPYPYFCLPSYVDGRGSLQLQPPAAQPTQCDFKSGVKVHTCDCGYYTYRDAHHTYFPGYNSSDGEEDHVDYSCRSFVYQTLYQCGENGCYGFTYPTCP